jgi:Coenzyme PQQ synthesis protein D (PqqD)
MEAEICRASIARIREDVIFRKLEEEAVILNLATGIYYGLDPVGTRIWELIQERGMVDTVLEAILHEYEVEPERCEQDLLCLLRKLYAKGLIEIFDAKTQEAS